MQYNNRSIICSRQTELSICSIYNIFIFQTFSIASAASFSIFSNTSIITAPSRYHHQQHWESHYRYIFVTCISYDSHASTVRHMHQPFISCASRASTIHQLCVTCINHSSVVRHVHQQHARLYATYTISWRCLYDRIMHRRCGRTQLYAATINQFAFPSYNFHVQLLWYPMFYPGGMKAG